MRFPTSEVVGLLAPLLLAAAPLAQESEPARDGEPWVVYEGGDGPGKGKHVVLVAGDEEYRSEEALPMLARILAVHHGFRCTVLFSTNPETGLIDPENQTHIPGIERVATADMLVLFLRFRELPDEDMRHIVEYVEAGKPVFGIRTSTHAFQYKRDKESPYAAYHWRAKGGFGRRILGETWVNHHGGHGSQSTRGVIEAAHAEHPILKGVADIWGPTDVYGVRELPADVQVLVRGQVVEGMQPDDPPTEGEKNDPMMPIVWVRQLGEKKARVICSTIGASVDLESAGLRRLFVNAVYWGAGLEAKIPAASEVDIVGEYTPTMFGFGKYKKGVRAANHRLE